MTTFYVTSAENWKKIGTFEFIELHKLLSTSFKSLHLMSITKTQRFSRLSVSTISPV